MASIESTQPLDPEILATLNAIRDDAAEISRTQSDQLLDSIERLIEAVEEITN